VSACTHHQSHHNTSGCFERVDSCTSKLQCNNRSLGTTPVGDVLAVSAQTSDIDCAAVHEHGGGGGSTCNRAPSIHSRLLSTRHNTPAVDRLCRTHSHVYATPHWLQVFLGTAPHLEAVPGSFFPHTCHTSHNIVYDLFMRHSTLQYAG
jgi:hypothetical protein